MTRADAYEHAIADHLTNSLLIPSTRPKVSSKYSDVLIEYAGKKAWLEVKMGTKDNLGNTRVFYDGLRWKASYKEDEISPLKDYSVNVLNCSFLAKQFIIDLKKHCGLDTMIIPTTREGLRYAFAPSTEKMTSFFDNRDTRYILKEDEHDLGKITREHYTAGKAEPVHYMQAGDNFYWLGGRDPFNICRRPSKRAIPLLTGIGTFKVRVSTRSQFYEVMPELKILDMKESPYSIMPGTTKENPFIS